MRRETALQELGVGWVEQSACEGQLLEDYFVESGLSLGAEPLAACRRCPVREECVRHAYRLDIMHAGYFGGTSPHQRREMTEDEAVEWALNDVETVPKLVVQDKRSTDVLVNVKERLRIIIEDHHFTSTQLAGILGTSQSNVIRWLQGTRMNMRFLPRLELIEKCLEDARVDFPPLP